MLREAEEERGKLEVMCAEAVREGKSNAKGRAIEIAKVTRLVGDKARLIEEQGYLESKVFEIEAKRVEAVEEMHAAEKRGAELKLAAAAERRVVEEEVARLGVEISEQRARYEAMVAGLKTKIEMQQADSEAAISERLANEKMVAELEVSVVRKLRKAES